jgi:hypothetical protein
MIATSRNKEASFTQNPYPYPTLFTYPYPTLFTYPYPTLFTNAVHAEFEMLALEKPPEENGQDIPHDTISGFR